MTHAWLAGGGEAGALMRSLDWSRSPLGAPETWPQPLRSVVGLLLGSKFPMFVAWGPELGYLYNDAYSEVLAGKHPAAMGARFRDIWSEIWPDIWPLVESAMRGEGSFREDLPLTMNRHGFDEQTWFTFSYSPVRDEAGAVAGMFCACVETTGRVLDARRQALLFELDEALRNLEHATPIMRTSAETLGGSLGADRVHWARIREADQTFQVTQEWLRPGTPSLSGQHQLAEFGDALIAEMRQGRTVSIDDLLQGEFRSPDVTEEGFGKTVRGLLAVPLFRGGVWESSFCVHTLAPRRWRDDERALVREVAERAWARAQRARAEARVRDSEARFRALVNATSDVVYRMSADWLEMRQLDGRGFLADTENPSVAWIHEYLFEEDQPAVWEAIDKAIRTKSPFELEHRVRRADGSVGWTQSRAVPLLGADGQIVEWFGAASDITERKAAETHLRLMVNELNHRVKNSLATVQAIAAQTLRRSGIPTEVGEALAARLVTLAAAHDVLTDEKWSGAELADLAAQAAAPYMELSGASPFAITGPSVFLPPRTAIALALAFHELATNAAKYGALSKPGGRVHLTWSVDDVRNGQRLRITWRESDGPPVARPARTGFGSRLIRRALAAEIEGEVKLDYKPSGLVCTMQAVLPEDAPEPWRIDLQLA